MFNIIYGGYHNAAKKRNKYGFVYPVPNAFLRTLIYTSGLLLPAFAAVIVAVQVCDASNATLHCYCRAHKKHSY